MIHVLLTRTPLYSPDCSDFLVRLACVRRAASVDSEPGSNSHLKHMRMARDKPRPQDRSAIYSEFSDEFFLLHPTRLSKICAAGTDIDNAGTDCRPRNSIPIAAHTTQPLSMKLEIQKDPNRKAVFHSPGGPRELCYRSLQRSYYLYHAPPSSCKPRLLTSRPHIGRPVQNIRLGRRDARNF